MENKKERKTNFEFSFLIQQLYGRNDYDRIRKRQTISTAKKYYLKILDTFSIAINETITVADRTQMELLNSIIVNGKGLIKKLNAFHDLDNVFISIQTQLIFQLIGLNPTRFQQKNVPNRKMYWKLNTHRQIQYVQDNKQKEMHIFNLLQSKYSDRFPDFVDFNEKIYWNECNHDLIKLLNWFKMNHSDIYYDLI